jgi:hypothetical protein
VAPQDRPPAGCVRSTRLSSLVLYLVRTPTPGPWASSNSSSATTTRARPATRPSSTYLLRSSTTSTTTWSPSSERNCDLGDAASREFAGRPSRKGRRGTNRSPTLGSLTRHPRWRNTGSQAPSRDVSEVSRRRPVERPSRAPTRWSIKWTGPSQLSRGIGRIPQEKQAHLRARQQLRIRRTLRPR